MSGPRIFHVAVAGTVHSRAFRCIWLLEELGVEDFEVCMLKPGEPYGPQMRRYGVRNAHKIPTLILAGQEIGESGVMSQVLAEQYQARCSLLGTPQERIEMLQWVAMAETCITFRIPLLPALMNGVQSIDELNSSVREPMRDVFKGNLARFEAHFNDRDSDYLLQSGFSVADTMCGWSLATMHGWGLMDLATGESPRTLAYLERLQSRPGYVTTTQYANLGPGLYGRGGVPL